MDSSRSEALHTRVRAFIEASSRGASTERFEDLALAIAAFQREHVAPIRRLASASSRANGDAWDSAIPALPVDVFRFARVAAHDASEDAITFRTSGTSLGPSSRGEHAMRTTSTYEAAALAWGSRALFPDAPRAMRSIVLVPSRDVVGDSSLGFMIDRFAWKLGGDVAHTAEGDGVDVERVIEAASRADQMGEAAIVMGTSFAFVHLIDALDGRTCPLPAGSRAMQTGGFKGRSREISAPELRAAIARAFEIPESHVAAEYGMTELSSQLYDGALAAALGHPIARGEPFVYVPPPWLRVSTVDPETLEPLPHGEIGLARFIDLANVDSSIGILTADRARVAADGSVELLGRAPGAPPRGCSLAIEDALGTDRA